MLAFSMSKDRSNLKLRVSHWGGTFDYKEKEKPVKKTKFLFNQLLYRELTCAI